MFPSLRRKLFKTSTIIFLNAPRIKLNYRMKYSATNKHRRSFFFDHRIGSSESFFLSFSPFFSDTSVNGYPVAYVRSIKISMKPAFFLNLIPDFSFFLPLSFSLFSLFFNKNSWRYIYIYIYSLSTLVSSRHRHYAITFYHAVTAIIS